MDATIAAEQSTGGFINWIMQYGSVVAFIAQLIYWLAIVVLLFYAVWQFKRWVNFQLGTGRSGQLREHKPFEDEKPAADDQKVAVEEFVD